MLTVDAKRSLRCGYIVSTLGDVLSFGRPATGIGERKRKRKRRADKKRIIKRRGPSNAIYDQYV